MRLNGVVKPMAFLIKPNTVKQNLVNKTLKKYETSSIMCVLRDCLPEFFLD